MTATPWYLFSLGIALVIFGGLSGTLFGGGSSKAGIDPRMGDPEIARRLKRRSSLGLSGVMVYAGLLCLLVSAVWRLLRMFL
jgi:hypothetical protein